MTLLLHEVTKIFPNRRGVQKVSLSIPKGSHFALMGRSGSGKSTLLRLIAGLEKLDSGSITWEGIAWDSLAPHQRGVAFVPQKVVNFPHLNVFENLALPLRLLPRKTRPSRPEIERKVHRTAEQLRLEQYLKSRPYELSGGEQQRVALGRAMIREAKLWLLDEPFAGLDPPLQKELSQELHLLRRALGLTIVCITHDPIDVMASADRIGLLEEGRLLQTGTPAEVYAQPSNLSVGFLFGNPSMNLLRGIAQKEGSSFVWESESGSIRCCSPCSGALTLGLRPEWLTPQQQGLQLGNATVHDCRGVGPNYWFLAQIDSHTRLQGVSLTPLTGVVTLYAQKWCWFRTETGERIALEH
jgi:multiple sugar transport system ATP-binding protein